MGERHPASWILTYVGQQFWPLDPRPEDIKLEDIAHALSMKCRFTGHCMRFYSVAEHCVAASHLVPEKYAAQALFHDAAEAYLPDVASPIKSAMYCVDGEVLSFREVEARLERAIAARFNLTFPWAPEIKEVDRRLLVSELGKNMAQTGLTWPDLENVEPYPDLMLNFFLPHGAEQAFIARARQLGIT
jgi:hypothetical protein